MSKRIHDLFHTQSGKNRLEQLMVLHSKLIEISDSYHFDKLISIKIGSDFCSEKLISSLSSYVECIFEEEGNPKLSKLRSEYLKTLQIIEEEIKLSRSQKKLSISKSRIGQLQSKYHFLIKNKSSYYNDCEEKFRDLCHCIIVQFSLS